MSGSDPEKDDDVPAPGAASNEPIRSRKDSRGLKSGTAEDDRDLGNSGAQKDLSGPKSQPQSAPQMFPSQQRQPPPSTVIKMAPMPDRQGFSQEFTTEVVYISESSELRRKFVKRVFSLLALMLIICAGMATIPMFSEWIRNIFREHWYLTYICMVPWFAIYLVLVCIPAARRKSPLNIILLMIFTILSGVFLMAVSASSSPELMLATCLVTAVVCGGIVMYAIWSPCDITKWGFLLFVGLLALLLFGISIGILAFVLHGPEHAQVFRGLNILYYCLSLLIFSLYLAYDTQLIVGGRRHQIEPHEVIYGALTLFVDVFNIFLSIAGLGRNM